MKSHPIFRTLVASAMLMMAGAPTSAQEFPNRPVRIIVPAPAGGIFDIVARVIADKVSIDWGKPIIVETRVGADGNIGIDAAAKAAPDGHTWLITGPALLVNPLIYGNLPWNGLRDFQGVGVPMVGQNIAVVSSSVPVKTLKEFAAYAAARPGQLNFGNSSTGASPHLSAELFFQVTGIKLTPINYKGQPPLIPDMLSGQVHFSILSLGLALPHIKSGKLTPLAMFTPQRAVALPDVPTVSEAGYPAASLVPAFVLYVPSATPKDIVARINSGINKAIGSPEVQSRLQAAGGLPGMEKTPEQIQAMVKQDAEVLSKIVRDAGIKPTN